jgi:hypothetical protein
LQVPQKEVTPGIGLRERMARRRSKPVLCRIKGAACLPDLFKFEDCLDFIGALCRLDEDKAQDFAARQCYLRLICDLGQSRQHVGIAWFDLRFLRRGHLARNGGRLL